MGLPTFNFRTDLPSGYFDVYNLGMLRPKETPDRVVFPPLNYIHIAMDFLRLRYTNKVSIKDHRIVGRGLKGRISKIHFFQKRQKTDNLLFITFGGKIHCISWDSAHWSEVYKKQKYQNHQKSRYVPLIRGRQNVLVCLLFLLIIIEKSLKQSWIDTAWFHDM